jgi:hypothetical protein
MRWGYGANYKRWGLRIKRQSYPKDVEDDLGYGLRLLQRGLQLYRGRIRCNLFVCFVVWERAVSK